MLRDTMVAERSVGKLLTLLQKFDVNLGIQ